MLCVVLAGGLTTNLLWCGWLIIKNRSAGEWAGQKSEKTAAAVSPTSRRRFSPTTCWRRWAGTLWYFQFFFYTMGESQMGKYGFSSWTLHMASIILFSTLWGFALKEWQGTAAKTRLLVWTGILTLVVSTVIIGIGNMLSK